MKKVLTLILISVILVPSLSLAKAKAETGQAAAAKTLTGEQIKTSETAIVCMAYGTDPSGQRPSPQMRSVISEALMLVKTLPDAGFILQGGWSFNGGPTESELMHQVLSEGFFTKHPIFTDKKSMDTIEGAREVAKLADLGNYKKLYIIAQKWHAWRVKYTFRKVLKETAIEFEVVTVNTPFGGNSQRRLNSAWRWWFWENVVAKPATFVLLR